MSDHPKAELPDGTVVEATPETDASSDLRDVDHFGAPLVFDELGNLVSGKQAPPGPPAG